jgi:hypothetical protein
MLPGGKNDSRDQEEQGGVKQGERFATTMSFLIAEGW